MKIRWVLGLSLLAGAATALAATPSIFTFYKEVQPPDPLPAAGALGGVVLDDEVLAALNERHTNLRLIEADQRDVPFLIRPRTERKSEVEEQIVPATATTFKELPDNRAQIVVARPDRAGVPIALLLHSAQANYEKQIDVYGSNDQQQWTPLAEGQSVFDYSRYIDVRNGRVTLAPGDWAFYRIDISNLAENRRAVFTEVIRQMRGGEEQVTETETARVRQEPFRVERMEFVVQEERAQAEHPVLSQWDIAEFHVEQDATAHVTRVEFATRKQPLVSLWLLPRDRNFSRRVTVAGTDGEGKQATWMGLTATTLSRVEAGSVHQAQLKLDLGDTRRFAHYRITIQNQDNPPLDIRSIQAEVETWEAVFFPPSGPVRLFYGGALEAEPQFDIGTVLAAAPYQAPTLWSLGPQVVNPDYRVEPEAKPARWGRPLLLVSILAMVALLFRVIAKAAKQVDGPPPG